MKKIVAVAALVVTLAGIAPAPAQAGGATNAALGLASFAVFNQLAFRPLHAAGLGNDHRLRRPVLRRLLLRRVLPPGGVCPPPAAYYPPPTYYAQPARKRAYAAPAPPVQNEVVYPHGRYVLRGDGVTSAYQWVWIANPAAAPSGVPGPAAPQPAR